MLRTAARIIQWGGFVTGPVLSAASLYFDSQDAREFGWDWQIWAGIGVASLFVAASSIIAGLSLAIRSLEERPKPRLVCSGFLQDKRPVRTRDELVAFEPGPTGTAMNAAVEIVSSRSFQPDVHLPQMFRFIHIEFKNDPHVRGKEANAPSVRAELEFRDATTGIKIPGLPRSGRWSETEQPVSAYASKADRDEPIDMLANAEPHLLDLAICHEEDGTWYAFNTGSYFAPQWGFREDWRLPPHVEMTVALSGENTRESWIIELQGLEGSEPPEFVPKRGNFELGAD